MQKDLSIPSEPQLIQFLEQVLSGNNEKIKQATQFMRAFRKTKESLSMFLQLIQTHQSPQIRQLSAVLCKKNICDIFENKLSKEEQQQVKQILITLFFNESVSVVKKAIGALIGFVATIALEDNNWNELLAEISQKTNDDQSIEQKKAGLQLLAFILDTSGDFLGAFYNNFFTFFQKIITDQSQEIQKETLKCLNYLFQQNNFNKEQELQYQQLVDQWLRVLDDCIKQEDEDLVQQTFETISLIAEQKSKLLNPYLTNILNYVLSDKILLNKDITDQIKEMSLDVIYSFADFRKSTITKNPQIMSHLINTLFQVVASNKMNMGSEDQTIQDSALCMIETLSITLPKKKVYKLLKNNIFQLINSNNTENMYSGFLILSRIIEGCSELLRVDLSLIMQLIPKGLQSEHPLVKGVTIFAISNMAEFINPDIFNYHQILLPALVQHLNDQDQTVVKQAIASIDLFCEYLEDKIVQYVPELIPKICEVINNQNSLFQAKQIAVSAYGSLAISCKDKLIPYLDSIFQVLNNIVYLQMTPQNSQVISESFQSLGKISANIFNNDINLYNKYILPHVEHIYIIMIQSQDPQVRESSLCFFYEVAATLGEGFQIYTEKLVKFALNLANKNEENEVVKPKREEFALDSESEDETNYSGNFKMSFVYEKIAAICALGHFAQATPQHYFPYFKQTVDMLNNQYNSSLTDIRVEVIVCYKNICESLVKYFFKGQLPKYEKGLPSKNEFNPDLLQFIQIDLMTKLLNYLEEDLQSDVVSNTLDVLQLLLSSLGPVVIENHIQKLVLIIKTLLKGEGKCQIAVDEDEDDEEKETDIKVWESLTDLLPVMAKTLKQAFIPIFEEIFQDLMIYADEDKDINDNIQLAGLLGECFKYVPELIQNYGQKILPWLLNTIKLQDEGLIRNSVYCFGVMFDKSYKSMESHQQNILQYIQTSFDQIQNPEVRDNIISCLMKIIMNDDKKTISLPQVMDRIMSQIPFLGDFDEQKTAIRFIFYLVQIDVNMVNQYFDKISLTLIDGLANKKEYNFKDRFVQQLVQYVKQIALINPQYAQKIEEQIYKLQSVQQQAVLSYLK